VKGPEQLWPLRYAQGERFRPKLTLTLGGTVKL
jgi:hypothetical protein